jgi:hypothetical protein
MTRIEGEGACPVMLTASMPQALARVANEPPQFESNIVMVSGDLDTALHRPDVGAVVPFSGPREKMRGQEGSRGSICGDARSKKSLTPRPLPPT